MTSNKRFKRRVRNRAAKTGEPYSTARQHLATEAELLETYLADVRTYPPVTEPEERALLTRARAGDADAGRAVVTAHLARTADLAIALAPGAGLLELDAVQEANLVLLELVESDHPTLSGVLDEAVRAKLSTP